MNIQYNNIKNNTNYKKQKHSYMIARTTATENIIQQKQ